jgi:hypothetical protein
MSKRHQSSRRKAYGRRQHEVRERAMRRREPDALDIRIDTFGATGRLDGLGLDVEMPRRPLLFAPAD